MADLASGQDVVIHLAAVTPPASGADPERARSINVDGTRCVIDALQSQIQPPRLIYASSVTVFGTTQDRPPPRRVADPLDPHDPYSRHKAECETLVQESGLQWAILRFTAVPSFTESFDPLRMRAMFSISPNDRMEMLHPSDAGLALANAAATCEIWGKVLLIAGGPSCQITMRDYFRAFLDAAGLGSFPDVAYSRESYTVDWYDTAESQAILHYQQHSFADFARELRRRFFWKRLGATLVRPFLRRLLLRYAPAHQTRSARRRLSFSAPDEEQ
jgi:UDP-glucose 4-epimerase